MRAALEMTSKLNKITFLTQYRLEMYPVHQHCFFQYFLTILEYNIFFVTSPHTQSPPVSHGRLFSHLLCFPIVLLYKITFKNNWIVNSFLILYCYSFKIFHFFIGKNIYCQIDDAYIRTGWIICSYFPIYRITNFLF